MEGGEIMKVKIAKLGESIRELDLESGSKIIDAIKAIGENNLQSYQIRLNGRAAALDTPLEPEDQIVLMPKIQGGM